MKLSGKSNGLDNMFKSKGKQNPVVIVVAVVVILGAVFLIGRNFMGGSSTDTTAAEQPAVDANGIPIATGAPGTPADPASAGAPPAGANPSTAGAPSSAGNPGAPPPGGPAATSPSAVNPGAPPAGAPKAPGAKPGANSQSMMTMTVFETVTVSYPTGWGLAIGGSNSFAAFTDGKARFEVHPPSATATTSRAMAASALKSLAKGGVVTAEGPEKIANQDAYVYEVRVGGQQMRIAAVDAPTRIVLCEYVKGGQMGAYKAAFSLMESKLAFR